MILRVVFVISNNEFRSCLPGITKVELPAVPSVSTYGFISDLAIFSSVYYDVAIDIPIAFVNCEST
jgi:hypothetical protein